MMKKIFNITAVLVVLSLNSCITPYASVQGLKSMDELENNIFMYGVEDAHY